MWMLGRPRRRLARVRLTGPDAADLAPGWRTGEGRDVVELTSVSGEAALAFVPGSAAAGDRLGDGATATIEVLAIIGDDPQPPGHDPAMRRRRDRPR
jgi:hypothetical protein